MSNVISWEAAFFLISVWLGCKLMLVYDGLCIFRALVPHKRLIRDAEDVLYWIFCALQAFALMYRENDGNIRWFSLAGIAMGMALWFLIFSKLLKKAVKWVRMKLIKRKKDEAHASIYQTEKKK